MPPDSAVLMATQDLASEAFICFGTQDQRTAATQAAHIRAAFASGGFCSYRYVSNLGIYAKLDPNEVVVFEPSGHHDDLNAVLFGNGHVDRVDDAAANEIARQFASGVRPIRIPKR